MSVTVQMWSSSPAPRGRGARVGGPEARIGSGEAAACSNPSELSWLGHVVKLIAMSPRDGTGAEGRVSL